MVKIVHYYLVKKAEIGGVNIKIDGDRKDASNEQDKLLHGKKEEILVQIWIL